MTFWKISYTIQDGINEYADSITCRFAGKQLDGVTAASKIADAWNLTDPDEAEAREQFITALASEGRADFPYDARESVLSPGNSSIRSGSPSPTA